MKVVIRQEPDDTIKIYLKQRAEGVAIMAQGKNNSEEWQIGVIQSSGVLKLNGYVSSELGLKLDGNGKIKVE